jgi:hypothetical protein
VIVAEEALTDAETGYVEAARAAKTVRGYRYNWAKFTAPAPTPTTSRCRLTPLRSQR